MNAKWVLFGVHDLDDGDENVNNYYNEKVGSLVKTVH